MMQMRLFKRIFYVWLLVISKIESILIYKFWQYHDFLNVYYVCLNNRLFLVIIE